MEEQVTLLEKWNMGGHSHNHNHITTVRVPKWEDI